ncbi:MAG: mechanosensitive ion channel [Bacteroidia bacterium]|nr:mechanosensitive ion channel [Bacteroidia bacterium]
MYFWGNSKLLPLGVVLAGLLILRTITLVVYKKRNHTKGKDNFVIGINTISYIAGFVIAILAVLIILKVNVREFFTSISIIAAAIAIISKEYISNAINGMILMFNNQITIGDYIKIGEHEGKIIHLSLMNLHLLNENDDLVYIPNNNILAKEIVNYSKGQTHKTVVEITSGLEEFETVESIEDFFRKALPDINEHVLENSFRVRIENLSEFTITIKVIATLKYQDRLAERKFKRRIINVWLSRHFHSDHRIRRASP